MMSPIAMVATAVVSEKFDAMMQIPALTTDVEDRKNPLIAVEYVAVAAGNDFCAAVTASTVWDQMLWLPVEPQSVLATAMRVYPVYAASVMLVTKVCAAVSTVDAVCEVNSPM